MRRITLPLLALACLLAPALAEEGDAARATPERWTHPRGPASRSGRSLARAPEDLGGTLWSAKARQRFLQPPLTWDGLVFALDGDARKARALVLDGVEGTVLASTDIDAPGAGRGALDSRSWFLVEGGATLVELHYEDGRLQRAWTWAAGAGAGAPCAFEHELYLASATGLHRLRAGRSEPAWEAPGVHLGDVTLFGDQVYAVRRTASGGLELVAHARFDGAEVASVAVADKAPADADPRVVVSEGVAAVSVAADRWVIFKRRCEFGKVMLEGRREEKITNVPLAGDDSLVGLDGDGTWVILRFANQPRSAFLKRADRPDLVDGTADPTVLDGTLVFGTWASKLNDNRIWWHLADRPGSSDFAGGVGCATVPLRHGQVLAVTPDGKQLMAIDAEKLGK